MGALPSANLSAFRRVFVGASLIVAALATTPSQVTFARPLAGDPLVDLHAAQPATEQTLLEQHIASLGAVVPLPTHFNPLWPTVGIITTYFGEFGPLSPRGHSGLDIAAPEGTPIVAADDGEVLKAYWNEDGYGGLIIIAHPSGYETWYGHLDRFDVQKGQQVKRGQQIALMGSTGFSTGPHLHFEVREDGQLRDPLNFLSEANLKNAVW